MKLVTETMHLKDINVELGTLELKLRADIDPKSRTVALTGRDIVPIINGKFLKRVQRIMLTVQVGGPAILEIEKLIPGFEEEIEASQ